MIYPKKLKDDITQALKQKQSPQEILCKLILWQFDDIKEALNTTLNKAVSIEVFLCAYLKIEPEYLNTMLLKLDDFKNKPTKDFSACCSLKI